MAVYQVTDPSSGRKLRLTGDAPPTEQELEQIFASQGPEKLPPNPADQVDMIPGMGTPVEKGNIDLTKRPVVKNKDGSISTVKSASFNIDGQEVLLPTISDDGRTLTEQEAVDTFIKTGKHLGKFKNPEEASTYAQRLHEQQAKQYGKRGVMDKVIGGAETALSAVTGATTGAGGFVLGGLEGIGDSINAGKFGTQEGVRMAEDRSIQRSGQGTYAPRTETGQEMTQGFGDLVSEYVPPVVPILGPEGAVLSGVKHAAPIVKETVKSAAINLPDMARKFSFAGPEPVTTGRASAGASATTGEAQRIATANSLPKPYKLTTGEATRQAEQLAFEKEQIKGVLGGPLRDRAEEHNLAALQNMEAIFDMTEAATPDMAAAGNAVTRALSLGWKKAKRDTKEAYDAANNSKESATEVDAAPLTEYLNTQPSGLATTPITDHIKKYAEILGIAKKGKDDLYVPLSTNVKTMEKLYKEINKVAGFDATKQQEAATPKTIINGLTDAVAGPLYRKAKDQRIKQARKYENRAIVARLLTHMKGMDDPKVAASEVFKRSILDATPEEMTFLKRVIQTSDKKTGPQAWKELQGAAARYIRDQSLSNTTDSMGNEIVSFPKFHNTLKTLDKNGRLNIVFGKKTANTLRDLDEVMGYVNTFPPGTLINNSGTAGALLGAFAEMATTGALTGIPVPVASIIVALKKHVKSKAIQKKIDAALEGVKTDNVTTITSKNKKSK